MNQRILPFLEYDRAYHQQRQAEAALDTAIRLLCPDNASLIIESPFQKVLEAQLKRNDPDLYSWYDWWVYECDSGNDPLEFSIDEDNYSTGDFETLEHFLIFIAEQYPL